MLTVRQLTSGYGKAVTIRDVDFAVADGQILGIAGKNGVGKTTLAKTIAGILKTMDGQVELDGQRIERMNSRRRAELGVGYVPQGRHIFDMTVNHNLRVGRRIGRRAGGARFHGSREFVHQTFGILRDFSWRNGQALSGGQQQMLAIGRALVGSLNLLILDEPSEGIQPSIVKEIGEKIRLIAAEHRIAVILIEQNIDLLMRASDEMCVLDKGAVVKRFAQVGPQMQDELMGCLTL